MKAEPRATVIFIGPITGFYSPNVVSKGIIRALAQNDILVHAGDTTWDGSYDHTLWLYDSMKERIKWLDRHELSDLILRGKVADHYGKICIAINPNDVKAPFFGLQEQGVKIAGMHVGDVDTFPDRIKLIMEKEYLILTPSSWCKQVIENAGITRPVMVLNHGVSGEFHVDVQHEEDYERPTIGYPTTRNSEKPFVFFHPCASVFYPERKSTRQVCEAFRKIVEAGHNVRLKLLFGRRTRQIQRILDEIPDLILTCIDVVFYEGSRPLIQMNEEYHQCHALLAPSRAEGFGIMPIEARCTGTPVIQTLCTGHADHLDEGNHPEDFGIQVVKHGAMQPAWGGLGNAPEVTIEAIVEGMIGFMDNYPDLLGAASRKSSDTWNRWQWSEVTKPLVDWIIQTAA